MTTFLRRAAIVLGVLVVGAVPGGFVLWLGDWTGFSALMAGVAAIITVIVVVVGYDFFQLYKRRVLAGVVFLLALAVLSASLTWDGKSVLVWLETAVHNPGGLFAVALGLVSVVGFTITISELAEFQTRISDYRGLFLRLDPLLAAELGSGNLRWLDHIRYFGHFALRRRVTDDEQADLRILASTPTLGNVSHQVLYRDLIHKKLTRLSDMDSLSSHIICLDPGPFGLLDGRLVPPPPAPITADNLRDYLKQSPLGVFYGTFLERGHDPDRVLTAFRQAVHVIVNFRHAGQGENKRTQFYDPEKVVRGATWPRSNILPPFNLFLTRHRAIVVLPLDRPSDLADTENREVTVVGFETADPRVILRLQEIFADWSDRLREASP